MNASKRQRQSNPPPDPVAAFTALQSGVETISQLAEQLKKNPNSKEYDFMARKNPVDQLAEGIDELTDENDDLHNRLDQVYEAADYQKNESKEQLRRRLDRVTEIAEPEDENEESDDTDDDTDDTDDDDRGAFFG